MENRLFSRLGRALGAALASGMLIAQYKLVNHSFGKLEAKRKAIER